MARRQRSVVTGVHRLDERQHLVAADFADHDAVGSQPQRRSDEVGHRDRWGAVGERRSGLEANHVTVLDRQFGGVLHHDESFGAGQRSRAARRRSDVLPDDVAPETTTLHRWSITARQQRRLHRHRRTTSSGRTSGSEPTDRQAGTVDGDRWEHDADSRAVGRRASTMGDDRSTRRPSGARTRSIRWSTLSASSVPTWWSVPRRSIQIERPALTITSSTCRIAQVHVEFAEPAQPGERRVGEQLLIGRGAQRAPDGAPRRSTSAGVVAGPVGDTPTDLSTPWRGRRGQVLARRTRWRCVMPRPDGVRFEMTRGGRVASSPASTARATAGSKLTVRRPARRARVRRRVATGLAPVRRRARHRSVASRRAPRVAATR